MDYRIEYEISAILILVILMVYFLVKPRRFSKQLNPGNEHSPTIMCHFVRPVEGGCELRTRFWMGYGVINGKPVKLIPDGVEFPLEPVKALLMHNIKEFTHLASILPEVYGEFKDKFTF